MINIRFEYQASADVLAISATAEGCGQEFDIGEIVEPDSENPALKLYGPVGINGVKQVIAAWEEREGPLLHCGKCGERIGKGEDEACWYCDGPLCAKCWDEHGHCGHRAANVIESMSVVGPFRVKQG